MKTRNSVKLVALSGIAALVLSACGGGGDAGADGETVTIGVITSLTGPAAVNAKAIQSGYELAVKEFNDQGGLQVELEFSDAASPAEGSTAAQRLITSKGAEVVVGTYASSVSATASEAAARLDTVYWETSAFATDLTDRDLPNFFRVGFDADDYGRTIGDAAALFEEVVGKPIEDITFYIEHEDSAYGTSIADAEEAAVKELGAQVVGRTSHQATASDLTGTVLKTKAADPDVWLMANYAPDTILLLRAAAQQGFNPAMRVTAGTAAEIVRSVGPEIGNGIFNLGYPFDLNPSFAEGSEEFLELYDQEIGGEPETPQVLNGYVGMKALLDLLEETDGDASIETFTEAAMDLDVPAGSNAAGGGIKFDETRQNTRALLIFDQWQSGENFAVWPEEARLDGTTVIPSDGS